MLRIGVVCRTTSLLLARFLALLARTGALVFRISDIGQVACIDSRDI